MRRHRSDFPVLVQDLAYPTHGVVSRQLLRTHGIDRHALRRLTTHGDALPHGTHAVRVPAVPWDPDRSPVVAAVINSGPAAWADGHAALLLAGLTGCPSPHLDVGVPENAASRHIAGVRRHRLRHTPPLRHAPVLHAEPHHAALHAAAWADTDGDASRVLTACVGQGIVAVPALHDLARELTTLGRRPFVLAVLEDLGRSHPSLHEFDLARQCRRHGLPEPDLIRFPQGADGRFTLEAHWAVPDVTVHITPVPMDPDALPAPLSDSGAHVLHAAQQDLQGRPQEFFTTLARLLAGQGHAEGRS